MQSPLIYKEEVYQIIGAAMEVHNVLKNGFLEPVYQSALAKELKLQSIPHKQEQAIEIFYKGE